MSDRGIVVLGSAVVDRAFRVEALPMPGESAMAEQIVRSLGGKGANQAAAARLLGAPTSFVGCVGDDLGGRETAADLEALGVDARLDVIADAPTGEAAVLVDAEGENQIAMHPGANAHLGVQHVEAARDLLTQAAVFVTQLEIATATVQAAVEAAGANEEGLTILNAAPALHGLEDLVGRFDLVVVNRIEAEQMVGVGIASIEDAKAAVRGIMDFGPRDVVLTIGASGALMTDRGRVTHVPAPRVEVLDATGAGDAFVGALAAFLREGQELGDAVDAAGRYAALAVTCAGTRAAYVDRAAFEAAYPDAD